MQNVTITTSDPILLTNCGQGRHAPADINDYLGRLVRSYDTVFTVVRVEPSTRVARRMDGSVIPGAARLYIAREEGDDGRPTGRWIEADTVAAPGLTVLHWDYDTNYREDPAKCVTLYQAATLTEQRRKEERRIAEEKRLEEEAHCEGLWKEFTPEWAKGYLIAEYHEDKSDIQTDYFAYSVTETVFLGFSKSDRNSFPEMRKMAATFPETAHLAGSEGVEHRENYSGGSGYYLGGDRGRYSGWIIRKRSLKYGLPRGGTALVDFSHWILNH
ncbi:fusion protein [uncultured Desulfovibrio sp.]|uniref:fusion protein n=1 Tax=uncultured Desulfovibrio sp. TaxID=167968 RepID=UPI0025859333|nr:fusion protein [uncultured Desulfovibrio sp.]